MQIVRFLNLTIQDELYIINYKDAQKLHLRREQTTHIAQLHIYIPLVHKMCNVIHYGILFSTFMFYFFIDT